MKQKTVLLYCSGIDDVLLGSSTVAGIQVQMSFWAHTFVKQDWKVYAFTDKQTRNIDGIHFIKTYKSKLLHRLHLEFVQDLMNCIGCIKIHPDIVIYRGASRSLFLLSKLCRCNHIQLVMFGASDRDFVPGKEIVGGSSLNRKQYQKSLNQIEYFVTQNNEQQASLLKYYGKDSMVLSNIWLQDEVKEQTSEKLYDAIWISNLRPLKRAEWFITLAKEFPQNEFAIVGGTSKIEYYNQIEQSASDVKNLSFLGPKSFTEVNSLLSRSRILVCTSEFEGFPNTFLQAWAHSVPVISTVNPSSIITEYSLGCCVNDVSELKAKFIEMVNDEAEYKRMRSNVVKYFSEAHSADWAYSKLIQYLGR